ncbi:MAG: hypothetical protein WCD00_12455, partial [Desulfuromonadaceae bacterium]
MKNGFLWGLGFVIACAVFVSGCSPSKEQKDAGNFVQNYCSVLQNVYARADMKILGNMATEKELKRVFPVLQALVATENVMKSEILKFKLKKTTVTADTATVQTSERWLFWWEDRKTGTITKPKVEESYELK